MCLNITKTSALQKHGLNISDHALKNEKVPYPAAKVKPKNDSELKLNV
jgi:hypothetical protein